MLTLSINYLVDLSFIASAIHLFVVLPTIFSIGNVLLLLAIIELIIALISVGKRKIKPLN